MTKRQIKVTLMRQIAEIWEYVVEVDDTEFTDNEEAYDTVADIINGIRSYDESDPIKSEKMVDSTVIDENIEWDD